MSLRLKNAVASALLFAVGAALIQTSLLTPLANAEAGGKVSHSEEAIFMIPFALIFGAVGLVMAAFFPRLFDVQTVAPRVPLQQRGRAYQASIALGLLLIMGLGFALRSWFLGRLLNLGYH